MKTELVAVPVNSNSAAPTLGIHRPQRSAIGLVACGLLILVSAVDRGRGVVDFLDWPAAVASLLLIMGTPHGAFDIELLQQKSCRAAGCNLSRLIGVYLSLALATLIVWWLLPTVALGLFLLLSAYHFGGDWDGFQDKPERFCIGAALLVAPTMLHAKAVTAVFLWLVPPASAVALAGGMHGASYGLIPAVLAILCANGRRFSAQRDEIVVVICTAVILPPITFFVVYFCALHSMRHLLEVRHELRVLELSAFVWRGVPYAIVAVLGCCAGGAFFQHLALGPALLSSTFVGLAALTVPHMLLRELP